MPAPVEVKRILDTDYQIDHVYRGETFLGSISRRRLQEGGWSPWTADITSEIIGKFDDHEIAVDAILRVTEGPGFMLVF